MALLVAHGLGRDAAEWASCARAIDDDAIVPDLPELRRVDAKPDTAAVITTLLAALGTRVDAVWLGHSGGAHVVLEAALAHPARVSTLVLVSAVPSRRALARLQCDVLVVAGETERVEFDLDRVRVATIGAGHDPHREAPDALVALVRAWMQSHRA